MSSKKSLISFLTLIILTSFLTMAFIPPEPLTCSPGYWKNHTEVWVGLGYSPDDLYMEGPMTLLDALQGGYDTRESRFIVTGWLNEAYATFNPGVNPCGEE